jgi:Tfp pilus assembly protein PilF
MNYKKYLSLLILSFFFLITSCARPQPQTQLQFGILAAQKDLWDEAIFRWKKVIQADSSSAAAHNNLAVAYEKKGLWEEAEKEYETALELSPNNDHIIANYEKFKSRLKDLEGSEQNEDSDNKKKDEKEK